MKLKQWLREWWVEILLVALVGLAAFLLLERMNIRATLWQGVTRLVSSLADLVMRLTGALIPSSLSDLVGLLLVLAALVLAIWRLRWRLRRSAKLTSRACPRCGKALMRVHRKSFDRAISKLVVPVHRYKCSGEQCNWQGLRVDTGKHRHHTHGESSVAAGPSTKG